MTMSALRPPTSGEQREYYLTGERQTTHGDLLTQLRDPTKVSSAARGSLSPPTALGFGEALSASRYI